MRNKAERLEMVIKFRSHVTGHSLFALCKGCLVGHKTESASVTVEIVS